MKKLISTEQNNANIARVIELLADTPAKLEKLSQTFPDPAGLRQPLRPGGRSFSQILAHLLNCEARCAEAITLALLEHEPLLVSIHPERQLAKLLQLELLPFSDLLTYFKLRRAILLNVLITLTEEQWARTIREADKQRRESVYLQARSQTLHEFDHLAEIGERLAGGS